MANYLIVKQCEHCPIRRMKPEAECPAVKFSHPRICEWVDPDSPHFAPGRELQVIDLAKTKVRKHKTKPGEQSTYHEREDEVPEGPDANRKETLRSVAAETPTHPDPDTHQRIYAAAKDCPFRLESKSCCSADKCGPGGRMEGKAINMGVCYPCQAETLGIALD